VQLRVEKVSLMGTVIVPIFFMYYSIIKRRYMRNERYDNDSKFNKNLWKTQRCGGCNILGSGKEKFLGSLDRTVPENQRLFGQCLD